MKAFILIFLCLLFADHFCVKTYFKTNDKFVILDENQVICYFSFTDIYNKGVKGVNAKNLIEKEIIQYTETIGENPTILNYSKVKEVVFQNQLNEAAKCQNPKIEDK